MPLGSKSDPPEPPPSGLELAGCELGRRMLTPLRAAQGLVDAFRDPWETAERVYEDVSALGEMVSAGLSSASETPLNQELGPHRRFDWTSFDYDGSHAMRRGDVESEVARTCAAFRSSVFTRDSSSGPESRCE